MSDPLISIVVPAYNPDTQHLKDCLASVGAQTYTNWEMVVVDDGSGNDAACQCVTEYRGVSEYGDERIRYIRHEHNRGLSSARNTGIRESRGSFIMMLDSDDLLAPEYISTVSSVLNASPDCAAAYSDFQLFGDRNERLQFISYSDQALPYQQWNLRSLLTAYLPRPAVNDHPRLFWQIASRNCEPGLLFRFLLPPGPGTVFRKSVLERIGGYCDAPILRMGLEDWDFWISAAEQDLSVVHVPAVLYYYRQHEASLIKRSALWEYSIREFLYERHQTIIDDLGIGRAFLANGYRRSAGATWRNRQRLKALKLVFRALMLDPGHFGAMISRKIRLN